MAGKKNVNIRCIIKSIHPKGATYYKALDLKEHPNSILLDLFISKIAQEHEIQYEITVYRAKKDKKTGDLIPDPDSEVTSIKLTLTENETIFALYDEDVEVIAGGVATGAEAISGLAMGGYGEGGEVTKDGDKIGGSAKGGNLVGKRAAGKGGGAVGGLAAGGEAGGAAGGKVLNRDPKASSAGPKKNQKPTDQSTRR